MGSKAWKEKGFQANNHPPLLHSHDPLGNRIDYIEYHPAYHDLMQIGIENQLHSLPWVEPKPGAHLVRMAMLYLHSQNEQGTVCPMTMTFSCVPAIKNHLPQAGEWLPKITSSQYDHENRPYFEKKGITVGMAMTEKQGGTDVQANTTRAEPLRKSGVGEVYTLTGHKWFCSAPMCDVFLTLAHTKKGLSCFLLPRWKEDGTKNEIYIQRLKNKLGNRSNASAEIELHQAHAWLMGEEGRGVATIIEMVGLTRYDCMIGSSAIMKRALSEAVHHSRYRSVMGVKLVDQALMKNVLVDLCLETGAALALTYRAAICLENFNKENERLLFRLLMPVGKYWITKRAVAVVAEAMECLGGNGYIENSILPRLYREAPVNAIWEGSGNVQCLDVIRALTKNPEILEVFFEELTACKGGNLIYDQYVTRLTKDLKSPQLTAYNSRTLTERMAKALQAAQLLRSNNPLLSDAFCQARLGDNQGLLWGCLPPGIDCEKILSRFDPNS